MLFILDKIQRRIWSEIVRYSRKTAYYPYLYFSYWHSKFHSVKETTEHSDPIRYFSARPNPGAGIGHQMANWIAGYWFAKQFGLRFAHLPFSNEAWEQFLGFGHDEVRVSTLVEGGYRKVRLPMFDDKNVWEIERIHKIIASYSEMKVVFVCEQDQFYRQQYGLMDVIQQKFYHAAMRKEETLVYSAEHQNVAIHVRRGDILSNPADPNLQMRYISNDYFKRVLDQVLVKFNKDKPIHIYFFSEGKPDDFPEFSQYPNLHWCFDMDARQSFLHMVYADILITSKSSFSYKPALLNRNIKVCPANFWHGYPDTKDWILVDNHGVLIENE